MIIGIPKEIKDNEYRVGLTPWSVAELTRRGHKVLVQSGAGVGSGFANKHYEKQQAVILDTAEEIFNSADLIVKVKEPQPNECKMLKANQVLFTYLHLAPDPTQAKLLLESGATAIAYETVNDSQNRLPLLSPMSEVAGRMAIQAGAHCLEKVQGGSGLLLGGVPGVKPAKIVILGGGVVGTNAIAMAIGLGAEVVVIDRSLPRLRELNDIFSHRLMTVHSTQAAMDAEILDADLVVGAILIPGAAAPKLISKQLVKDMHPGSVIIDVAIDQGGCAETSRATTYSDPSYIIDDVVHYCVANMPGGVARTSTCALNNATLPFVLELADKGYKQALLEDKYLMNGLNISEGKITYKAVADELNLNYYEPEKLLSA